MKHFFKSNKTIDFFNIISFIFVIYLMWCVIDVLYYRNPLGDVKIVSVEIQDSTGTPILMLNDKDLKDKVVSVPLDGIIHVEYSVHRKRTGTLNIERNFFSDDLREYNLSSTTKTISNASLDIQNIKSNYDLPPNIKFCGYIYSRTSIKFTNNILTFINPVVIEGPRLRVCISA